MRYGALHGFYSKEEGAFYLSPSDFKIMSNDQLLLIIEQGIIEYQQVVAKRIAKSTKRFRIYMAVVASCVGGALATSGTPAAAAPATGTTSAATGASAASGAAASASTASTGLTFAKVQEVASYLATAEKIRVGATGDEPSKLAAAANLIASPSMTSALEKGAQYVMAQEGMEIAEDDANAKLALREMVEREQQQYAANLKAYASQLAERQGVPQPAQLQPKEPIKLTEIVSIATPFLLLLLSRG